MARGVSRKVAQERLRKLISTGKVTRDRSGPLGGREPFKYFLAPSRPPRRQLDPEEPAPEAQGALRVVGGELDQRRRHATQPARLSRFGTKAGTTRPKGRFSAGSSQSGNPLPKRASGISGRQDLNLRPLGPQPSALPDCATPRGWMHCAASGGFRLSQTRIGTTDCQLPPYTNVRSPGYVCRMRRCGRCNREKPVEEFAWRRKAKGQRDNYCRPCRAAYKQEHYATNRQKYIDAAQRRRRAIVLERVRYLVEYLRDHPCVDCGETDPDRLRVRPPTRQGIRHWKGPTRPGMAERARRDGKVRGGLCKLSPSSHRSARRLSSRGGSSTVEPRPSKAMMRVRLPSAAYFFFFFFLTLKVVVLVVLLPAASVAVIVSR